MRWVRRMCVTASTRCIGNISAESNKEIVDCSEFLRGPDIKRNRTGVEIVGGTNSDPPTGGVAEGLRMGEGV